MAQNRYIVRMAIYYAITEAASFADFAVQSVKAKGTANSSIITNAS